MKRRVLVVTAFVVVLSTVALAVPAWALEEAERLWLVGEHAWADGLSDLARGTLERLVTEYPTDARVPPALLLLGRVRLAAGDAASALKAFRRAQAFDPKPGRPQELTFWEAEALFRLKRFAEASAAYDSVVRNDAASPLAPEALYGYAWAESELGRRETAAEAFRQFLRTWPEHPLGASATFHLARTLVDLKRLPEALPLLESFVAKHPHDKLAPDARYLLGWARVETGEARDGLRDLRAFVAESPSHPQAGAARRLILHTVAHHGDRNEMRSAYKALMAQSPPTVESLYDAATIAERLGRARDREAAWRKLLSAFPDHPLATRAALELASAAYKRKDWKETVTRARAASRSDDDAVRAEAWLMAGEAELKLKRFQAAEKSFKAATGISSAGDDLRYRAIAGLGLAHEEQREWKSALTAYEDVADKSPDQTLRDWAKARAQAVKRQMSPPPAAKKSKKSKSGS